MTESHKTAILIAHPNWEDFSSVDDVVGDLDVELIWAANVPDAFGVLENRSIEMLVTDPGMCTAEGRYFFQAVKARPEWSHLHVIVLSPHENNNEMVELLEIGADDVMMKPLSPQVFRSRLRVGLRMLAYQRDRQEMNQREGVLATVATVAHEINNPLFAIMGNIEMIQEELESPMGEDSDGYIRESLRVIAQEAERINSVVKRLQQITNPNMTIYLGKKKMVDLEEDSQVTTAPSVDGAK